MAMKGESGAGAGCLCWELGERLVCLPCWGDPYAEATGETETA